MTDETLTTTHPPSDAGTGVRDRLAVRLLLWVIGQCAPRSEFWRSVEPGSLCMHMTSLHVFATDRDWLQEYDPAEG